jgi:hypothetical protein
MRIEYESVRNIASGHAIYTTYEIVVLGEQYENEFKFSQTRNTSLDRSRTEVDLWGTDQLIDVVTDLIAIGSATDIFEEFLHSVAAGEQFVFDGASDTAETEVDAINVIMESGSYRREKPIPGFHQYRFTVRVV